MNGDLKILTDTAPAVTPVVNNPIEGSALARTLREQFRSASEAGRKAQREHWKSLSRTMKKKGLTLTWAGYLEASATIRGLEEGGKEADA